MPFFAENEVRFTSHSLGMICICSSSSFTNFPLLSNHKSASNLTRGTQSPVNRKAEATPKPASIPKDLKAAIFDVRLARKATIVVVEVRRIALPTREIDSPADSLLDFPFFLSSL